MSEAAPGEGTAQPDDAGFDDYDIFSAELRNCPHQRWARMQQECPVAHSDRFGGSWLVTRFADIKAMTRDPELYSSRVSDVGGPMPGPGQKGLFLPPITSDPPEHAGHRGVLLPFLVPARVAELEPFVRERATALARALADQGGGCSPGCSTSRPRRPPGSSSGPCGCSGPARWTRRPGPRWSAR